MHRGNFSGFVNDRDLIIESDLILAMKGNKLRVIKNRDPDKTDIYPLPEPIITSMQHGAGNCGSHTHSFSVTPEDNSWITKAVEVNQAIEIGIDLISSVFFGESEISSFKELLKIRLREQINNELQKFKV